MSGSNDSDDNEQQEQSDWSETGLSLRVPIRDPYFLLILLFKKILRGVNWLYERYSWLPGWAKVGVGIIIFLLGIFFDSQIQAIISFLISITLGQFFGELIHFPFDTLLTLFLLLIISIQAAIINYRLFVIENEVMDDGMETNLRLWPDGGRPPNHEEPDDTEQVSSSGSGALAGAATGAVLGSGFGPGGAIGGAILGAILGDELEKSSIRKKRHRVQNQVGGFEIETYTINTDSHGRISQETLSKQIVSVKSHRQDVVYFHFDMRSENGEIQILTEDNRWTTSASLQNIRFRQEEQVEFEIRQTNYRPEHSLETLIIDVWLSDQAIEESRRRVGSNYRNATHLAMLRPRIPLTVE